MKKGSKKSVKNPVWRQILAAVMIFLAVFLIVSFFSLTGNLGKWYVNILRGLFGTVVYVFPLLFAYFAVWSLSKGSRSELSIKITSGIVAVLSFTVIFQLFSKYTLPEGVKISEMCKLLFSNANSEVFTGGVFGGLIGIPLINVADVTGTAIIVGLILLISFMLLTGITLMQIINFFSPFKKGFKENIKSFLNRDISEGKEESAVIHERNTVKDTKKPNIDIPVDDPIREKEIVPERIIEALSPDKNEINETVSKIKKEKESDCEPIKTPEITVPAHSEEDNGYTYPPLTLLKQNTSKRSADLSDELKANGEKLINTLKSFGVEASIINISRGPAVTRFELAPGVGVKISKISNLADDIALSLAALGVRIEAPIPGKSAVGIEIPNSNINSVFLRDILSSKEFTGQSSNLTVALGKDVSGNTVVADLAKMPHLLVAGATGSGKSVCINTFIMSLLFKSSPDKVKLLLIDPKVVELRIYDSIPHLLIPVVTDPKKAAGALNWAVSEMLKRYKLFADNNVRDIQGYNSVAKVNEELEEMPEIVIFIDELADLMMAAPNEVEDSICRLAQMARAAGMHLVIATQRPSVDVITGTIKTNIPSRISFAVSSQIDSRIILDMSGAEKLIGKGDMLFYPVGAAKPMRVQGCFVSDKEVEEVVSFISRKDKEYSEEIIEHIESHSPVAKGEESASSSVHSGDGTDEMLNDAIGVVVDAGLASVSLLQRKLKLGYARAARIVDQMEEMGIVGPYEGSKPRKVLISKIQWQEMQMNK